MDPIILAYASQTGQSKAIAHDMCDLANSQGIYVEVKCMSSFDKEFSLEKKKHMLFVASTTGDGDPPDTAIKFWRYLKKSKENLENMSYALLGLGDSNYTNFCNFGKMLDKRLKEMKAKPFIPSMWADDAVGLETIVNAWMGGAIDKLLTIVDKSECVPNVHPPEALKQLEESTASLSIVNKSTNAKLEECSDSVNLDNSSLKAIPFNEVLINSASNALKYFRLDFEILKIPSCPVRILEIIPGCLITDEHRTTFPPHFKESNYFCLPNCRTKLELATLKHACNLTEGNKDVKKILYLEFDISDCSWDTEILPGDTVGIMCPNNEMDVRELLSHINLDCSKECSMATFEVIDVAAVAKKKIVMPEKCRIIDLLTWHMDIRSVPKKAFLRSLMEVTEHQEERKVLELLCSQQGSEYYTKLFVEHRLNIVDLLKFLPSCKPSLGLLYEHLPRLQPRVYSICNSQLTSRNAISVVFSIAEHDGFTIHDIQTSCEVGQTDDQVSCKITKMGLCTGWLYEQYLTWSLMNDLSSPIKVAMFLRKPTQFRLPEDPSEPLILIGAGTGVSPFIGFLQHRKSYINTNVNFGDTWLFFGCRGQNDFIFKRELVELKNSGVLSHLQVCFSREEDPACPRYVQDGLILHGNKLAPFIFQTTVKIYICGDAKKLVAAVKSALKLIFQSHADMTENDADLFYEKLRFDKRIIEDVWT